MSTDQLPVRIITPHDGLDAFRYAFSSLIRDRRFTLELAWRMFLRDTRATVRQSFLGYLWLVLPALANSLVWVFLSGTEVVSISSGDTPYPLFVFVGTLLWTAFNSSVVASLAIIDEARGTLAKVNFPQECLVLVAFGKAFLNTAATALCAVPFFLLYPIPLHWGILLFPVGILVTMCAGIALGLLVVPISAMFNDLSRGIHLGLRFGFFLTPVIFPLPAAGLGRTLMLWNPVTCLVVSSRAWLLGGEAALTAPFIVVAVISCIMLGVGVLFLKVSLPHIIERLGSG